MEFRRYINIFLDGTHFVNFYSSKKYIKFQKKHSYRVQAMN
jgi:hypothetical protein